MRVLDLRSDLEASRKMYLEIELFNSMYIYRSWTWIVRHPRDHAVQR